MIDWRVYLQVRDLRVYLLESISTGDRLESISTGVRIDTYNVSRTEISTTILQLIYVKNW